MQQQRCALLTFVIGILLVTASCGDKMVVPTSGAAGIVIDAEGQVNAIRGSEASRPLQTGDTVFVKDTVITSANSSVSIELTHNRAIWTLGSNEESAMEQSLAWTLAKQKPSVFANNVKIGNSAAASDHGKTAAATADTLQQEIAPQDVTETENKHVTPSATAVAVNSPAPPPTEGPDTNSQSAGIGGIVSGTTGTGHGGGGKGSSTIAGASKTDKTKRPKRPLHKPGDIKHGGGTPTNTHGKSPGGNSGGESTEPNPKPPEPAKKPEETVALAAVPPLSAESTRATVQKIASACHKGSEITGDVNYTVTAVRGKITNFTSKQDGSLSPIAKCMKKKVLLVGVTGSGKVKGKISF